MKRIPLHVLLLWGALMLGSNALLERSSCAGEESGIGQAALITDRLIVSTQSEVSIDTFIEAFENDPANVDMALSVVDQISGRPVYLLALDAPDDTDYVALELRLESNYTALIVYGEILYDADAPEGSEGATGSTYVDGLSDGPTDFRNQFATTKLNLADAQARSQGQGIAVAVLDTGVDGTHPELAGRVLPFGYNFVENNDDTRDVGDGIDTDGDLEVDEMVGHGTYVAGLVNLVAPGARILPVRVMNGDGRTDLWVLTEGIYYAIDRGVEVINISIRSTYNSQAVEDALEEAARLGIVAVGAAGNHNLERREFPGANSSSIGVVAVDDIDRKAGFSSFSDKVTICAPGASLATGRGGTPDIDRSIISILPDDNFAIWEGTSMATPLVAGTVALLRAQHPQWEVDPEISNEWMFDSIENLLNSSAVNIYPNNPGFDPDDEFLGSGRLDTGTAASLAPVAPAFGDLSADGVVNVEDLLKMLADWGRTHTTADLNADGTVDVNDLLLLLALWG